MQAFNPNTINFTDQAILHFTNALSGKPDEFAIRIGVREAGCSGYEYFFEYTNNCLLYTSPSPRDLDLSRMPSSA